MVGVLILGSNGPSSSPGRGHCVVFLGKTLKVLTSVLKKRWSIRTQVLTLLKKLPSCFSFTIYCLLKSFAVLCEI